jgi:hypothetical protein
MVGTLLKALAYYKAPRLTYTVRHPKNAARLAKTGWDLKHAWAPRATGIAAAAVALPLGYLIGRMSTQRRGLPASSSRRARSAPDFY